MVRGYLKTESPAGVPPAGDWDGRRNAGSRDGLPNHLTRHSPRLLKNSAPVKQSIVTLDMEGVLTPEIWIALAEKTKIPELRRTTRDEPDYDKLMRYRIARAIRRPLAAATGLADAPVPSPRGLA